MPFEWSLNPYMGCVHRCTFCYVRAFERRADRPSDDRYGTSIRVKLNIAEVLRARAAHAAAGTARAIAIGAATDPYQPAEGRYRLTRACLRGAARRGEPVLDHHARPADRPRRRRCSPRRRARADVPVTFSVPTIDDDVWRTTEPGTAPPRQRLRALRTLVDAGVRASVGMAPLLPGLSDHPSQIERVVVAAREAGACGIWANLLYLRPGTREHFLDLPRARLARAPARLRAAVRRGARTCRSASRGRPAKEPSAARRASTGSATGGAEPLRPPARDEQLSLLSSIGSYVRWQTRSRR